MYENIVITQQRTQDYEFRRFLQCFQEQHPVVKMRYLADKNLISKSSTFDSAILTEYITIHSTTSEHRGHTHKRETHSLLQFILTPEYDSIKKDKEILASLHRGT